MVRVELQYAGEKYRGCLQIDQRASDLLYHRIVHLQTPVRMIPGLHAADAEYIAGLLHFRFALRHQGLLVIRIGGTAQRAICQYYDMSRHTLQRSKAQRPTHAKGFIVGMRRKNNPGRRRQIGYVKGDQYVFRIHGADCRRFCRFFLAFCGD